MGATANLYGVRSIYGLCFVLAPWAYFTRLQLAQRWGDRGKSRHAKFPPALPIPIAQIRS